MADKESVSLVRSSPATDEMDEKLENIALRGLYAVCLECFVCVILACIVILLWRFGNSNDTVSVNDLLFPLCVIGSGFIGSLFSYLCVKKERRKLATSIILTKWFCCSYLIQYYLSIICIMTIDIFIRLYFDNFNEINIYKHVFIVIANWCGLIGSASTISLFILDIPYFSLRKFADKDASQKCVCTLIGLSIQMLQISLLLNGAFNDYRVIIAQIICHRILAIFTTNLFSIFRYNGCRNASDALRNNVSLEYVILSCAINNDGIFLENNLKIRVLLGNILLKIPFISGESMCAGVVSLTRIMDKLLFMEQIFAFGSPTMIVLPELANGHIAFFRYMVKLDERKWDDTDNQWIKDSSKCKEYLYQFLQGQCSFSTDTSSSDNDGHIST